jgi:hypothetical protein
VTFTVGASGLPPLFYQWYFNSNAVLGANTDSLSITNVQLSNAGNYFVVVSNTINSATSKVAVLTVTNVTNPTNSAPVITQQPPSHQDAIIGTNVTISVTATSAVPVFYQWLFQASGTSNATTLAGATNNVLTITNAQTNNSGSYSAIITNTFGAVTSSISDLVVGTNGTSSTNVNINPTGFLRIKGVAPAMQMVLVPNNTSRSTDSSTDAEMGSASASGAVRRASRLTEGLGFSPALGDFARLSVRREARRTTAGRLPSPELKWRRYFI